MVRVKGFKCELAEGRRGSFQTRKDAFTTVVVTWLCIRDIVSELRAGMHKLHVQQTVRPELRV